MQTRLFDDDPITGVRKLWHWDPVAERATIETVIDATKTLELNKAQFTDLDERAPWKGDLHKIASIPMPLYWELKKQGIVDDEQRFRAWLNDADNRLFRTRPGRV